MAQSITVSAICPSNAGTSVALALLAVCGTMIIVGVLLIIVRVVLRKLS